MQFFPSTFFMRVLRWLALRREVKVGSTPIISTMWYNKIQAKQKSPLRFLLFLNSKGGKPTMKVQCLCGHENHIEMPFDDMSTVRINCTRACQQARELRLSLQVNSLLLSRPVIGERSSKIAALRKGVVTLTSA